MWAQSAESLVHLTNASDAVPYIAVPAGRSDHRQRAVPIHVQAAPEPWRGATLIPGADPARIHLTRTPQHAAA